MTAIQQPLRKSLWRSYTLALGIFSAASCLYGQTDFVIDVSDHRPLARALETLQALTGIAINYEDVPYENPVDFQNISTPRYHVLAPRKGQVKATVEATAKGSLVETLASVHALLASYRAAGMPGDFKVEQANGMIYVVPTKVLSRVGFLQGVQPQMNALISFPSAQMRASDCAEAITRAVSETTRTRVVVGAFPPFPAQQVSCGADREAARDVLAALLSKWSNAPFSYELLFEPGWGYMLNLRPVPRSEPSPAARPAAPSDTTSKLSTTK